jgi:hypothetical protein
VRQNKVKHCQSGGKETDHGDNRQCNGDGLECPARRAVASSEMFGGALSPIYRRAIQWLSMRNRSIGSGVSRLLQYSDSPLGLEVEKVVVLWRGANAAGLYAAALGLLRNMMIPSHTNHTI